MSVQNKPVQSSPQQVLQPGNYHARRSVPSAITISILYYPQNLCGCSPPIITDDCFSAAAIFMVVSINIPNGIVLWINYKLSCETVQKTIPMAVVTFKSVRNVKLHYANSALAAFTCLIHSICTAWACLNWSSRLHNLIAGYKHMPFLLRLLSTK